MSTVMVALRNIVICLCDISQLLLVFETWQRKFVVETMPVTNYHLVCEWTFKKFPIAHRTRI